MLEKVIYKEKDYCPLEINDNVEECKKYWIKTLKVKDHESNTGYYDIMKCEKCGISFTNPYPTEKTVKYLYMDRDTADSDKDTNTIVDCIKNYLARRKAKQLILKLNFAKNSKLQFLDFGTGSGRYAVAAASVSSDAKVYAMDFQDDSPEIINNSKLGNIKYISYDTFIHDKNTYDIIFIRHVLEHMHKPRKFLQHISEKLEPNGFLYIETPNLDSGYTRFFGGFSKLWYVPRHIHHFTKKSLTDIINNSEMMIKGEIGKESIPYMGNTLQTLFGLKKGNMLLQLVGIILHPFQMFLEFINGSSTCLSAIAYKKNNDAIKSNNKN